MGKRLGNFFKIIFELTFNISFKYPRICDCEKTQVVQIDFIGHWLYCRLLECKHHEGSNFCLFLFILVKMPST